LKVDKSKSGVEERKYKIDNKTGKNKAVIGGRDGDLKL